jgi:hypothetical protein
MEAARVCQALAVVLRQCVPAQVQEQLRSQQTILRNWELATTLRACARCCAVVRLSEFCDGCDQHLCDCTQHHGGFCPQHCCSERHCLRTRCPECQRATAWFGCSTCGRRVCDQCSKSDGFVSCARCDVRECDDCQGGEFCADCQRHLCDGVVRCVCAGCATVFCGVCGLTEWPCCADCKLTLCDECVAMQRGALAQCRRCERHICAEPIACAVCGDHYHPACLERKTELPLCAGCVIKCQIRHEL